MLRTEHYILHYNYKIANSILYHKYIKIAISHLRISVSVSAHPYPDKMEQIEKLWSYSCRPYHDPHIGIRKERPQKWLLFVFNLRNRIFFS